MYSWPAQNQLKYQIQFHKNNSHNDLYSIYNDFGQGNVFNQLTKFFGAKFKRMHHKKSCLLFDQSKLRYPYFNAVGSQNIDLFLLS